MKGKAPVVQKPGEVTRTQKGAPEEQINIKNETNFGHASQSKGSGPSRDSVSKGS